MLVSDKHDREPPVIQVLEDLHDLDRITTIEVASGLVCQQDGWLIDQSSGYRY